MVYSINHMAYVPPWTDIGPQTFLQPMESGANVGLKERELSDQERSEGQNVMLKEQQMGLEDQQFNQQQKLAAARIPLELMQINQQKQQMQADLGMKTMQMQMSKQESDRQFQLQQQQMANEMAVHQQQIDLQTKAAAQKFQAQQQYQQYYNQLVNDPENPTDPAEASSLAFAKFGPLLGESMAGSGAMLKATMPPPPPKMVTDPESGQQAWNYNGRIVPVKSPEEADDREQEISIKDKANFVNNFIKSKSSSDPQFGMLPQKEQMKEALEAWDQISDDGSDEDGGTEKPDVPVTQKFKIISFQ